MKAMSLSKRTLFGAATLLLVGSTALSVAANAVDPDPTLQPKLVRAADNQYIGAKKCKSCHQADEVGNQYGAWEEARHSKAFDTLASDEAKKIASEKGIADPQKADECLRCHVTAFGVDESMIKRGFKSELGVQCETCHGPGADHMKARFDDAAAEKVDAKPAPGEIIATPTKATCKQCHNEDSPTAKEFCFHDSSLKIAHLHPERAAAVAAIGISDCSSCHTTGAELIAPNPAFCTTCHEQIPEPK